MQKTKPEEDPAGDQEAVAIRQKKSWLRCCTSRENDIEFTDKQLKRISVIRELFEQQEYMYRNKVHSVKNG